MTGIYKITNKINGKSYVGQSKNIYRRWKSEIADSNNISSSCYDYPLMRAFRKYGINNFEFEVIEECIAEELNQREVYWINHYDTFFNGYNQTFGGGAASKQPKENIIGIIHDLTNTNMLHKEIAAKWNTSTEMVQGINTGRYWRHNADYPLQKRELAKISRCEKCEKEITKGSKLCLECYNALNTVNKPDKDTLFDELHKNNGSFTTVGKMYNVSANSVKKWCVKYGIPNHSSDYKEKITKEKVREFKISVIQLDVNTNKEIARFESILSAARSLGLNDRWSGSHIAEVCNDKRKSAYGYKWKFA